MYLQLELNNIYTMDCLDGINFMKKQSLFADVIITSPPYNIGKKYEIYNDNLPREDYLYWMEKVAKNSKNIIYNFLIV